jgi:hypothetical protein
MTLSTSVQSNSAGNQQNVAAPTPPAASAPIQRLGWRRWILPFLVLTASFGFTNWAQADDSAVSLSDAYLTGVQTQPAPDGLRVDYSANELYPNILWKSPTPDGWNWSAHSALVFSLSNPGSTDLPFHVKVSDHTENGDRHSSTGSGVLKAHSKGKFFISLLPRSVQNKSGMRCLPMDTEPGWGNLLTGGIESSHVDDYQIFTVRPPRPATIIVEAVTLSGPPPHIDLTGLIDGYGQSTLSDWPGKIHVDGDFALQKAAEAQVKANVAERDKWGGSLNWPRRQATGYFRTELIDGRWWMIDPDGNRFLSVGVDVVGASGDTLVDGRQYMFANLPTPTSPMGKYYTYDKRSYDFLRANLARKYGTFDLSAFGDLTVKRLRSWGFNSFGNWSAEEIASKRSFPFVAALGPPNNVPSVPSGIPYGRGNIADPFDPAFPATVDASVRVKTAQYKSDPACIGYFYDNELSWGMPGPDSEHFGLCFGVLEQGASCPAKQAFAALVRERYTSIDALNAAWETKFASWSQFSDTCALPAKIVSSAQRKDFSDFLTLFAEKYFTTVSGAIKRSDPNHLYLGCRFAYWFTPEAVSAEAKYADVISFNIYNWNRDTYLFAERLGKPCLVGEFHFGATDRGMYSGDITVANQQDRAMKPPSSSFLANRRS